MIKIAAIFFGFMLGFCLLPSPSFAAEEPVRIPWLQDNLVPNPDFEEVASDGQTPTSWTAEATPGSGATGETDSTVFLQGKRSLKLNVPQAGTQVKVTSVLFPVEGGASYLVSLGLRGIGLYPWIDWFDENRKLILRQPFYCPPAPSWDLRDILKQAPAEARFAQLGFPVIKAKPEPTAKDEPATLWIDAVQFRKYLPPPDPEWSKGETVREVEGGKKDTRMLSYFVGIDDDFQERRGGNCSKVVSDPDAERGTALQARTGVAQDYIALSVYYPALPAGLYRARVRIKIPATQESGPVGSMTIGNERTASRQELPFLSTPGKEDKYVDLEADFTVWDPGYWQILLTTFGKVAFSIDSIKVYCLADLQDQQLVSIYPGSEGVIPDNLKTVAFGASEPMKGLIVAGVGYDRFRISDLFNVLHHDTKMKVVWANTGDHGTTVFTGFPENPREFFDYSIIFLCNVNLRAMALKDKNALREYVKRGGALVVMGGNQGYERGGWRGSLIEEALPVESAPSLSGGLVHLPQGERLEITQKVPWLEGVSTAVSPLAYYLHNVTVKPSGTVLVQAGGHPFMVTGSYGEGRVVCILGDPWGDPGPHETAFWQWDEWIDLLRETCWWAMKNPSTLLGTNPE